MRCLAERRARSLPFPALVRPHGRAFLRLEGLTTAGLRDARTRLCMLLGPKRAPERMPRNRGVGRERK